MNYFSKIASVTIMCSMGFLSLNAQAEEIKIINKVASADQTIDKIVADLNMSNPVSVEANSKELIAEVNQAGGQDKIEDLMETKSLKQIAQIESKETVEAVIAMVTPVSETFEEIVDYSDIYKQTGENNYKTKYINRTFANTRYDIGGRLIYRLIQVSNWKHNGSKSEFESGRSYPVFNNDMFVSLGWGFYESSNNSYTYRACLHLI
jgi:hypothetical protein